MTARVGAVHLGWDVVSVAAGGGGTPIRPVQVEGTYTPPAYLLADASGRLHTAGAERQRPDLGIAISDVRDVLGHRQIRIAGATWPVELVFRARMYNPMAAIGKHVRGKPEVVALPYPDDWPDEKIDEYCRLVEMLDVSTEPLPESVALSGYVRALGLVGGPGPHGPAGATGVYSDGRVCLVVAVHGDDEQPTESVGVPISPEAMRDAMSADNVVIEVMAAARSIGADTSTVLLTGNVCFNDALRLAFQNHLGHRLRVADHPMHALALGAAHLLVTDSEYADEDPYPEPARPAPPPEPRPSDPAATRPPNPGAGHHPGQRQPPGPGGHRGSAEAGPSGSGRPAAGGGHGVDPGNSGPSSAHRPGSAPGTSPTSSATPTMASEEGGRHSLRTPVPSDPVRHAGGRPVDQGPRHAAREIGEEPTTRVVPEHPRAEPGSRFTRPPSSPADDQMTVAIGRPDQPDPGARGAHAAPDADHQHDDEHHGKLWHKVKDNLFGAPTIAGAVALAAMALSPDGATTPAARPAAEVVTAVDAQHSLDAATSGVFPVARVRDAGPACALTPHSIVPRPDSARDRDDCPHLGIDNLHYLVPAPRGTIDPGPPIHI
ncbi:hypothetical protein BJY24_003531 [Nocardia transvalensis]|uniref:Uncharacterized protein n=1 Tax=Nocardia transvalensis TaxID=37333 RepID=A0A7W9PEH7_9NOCA|nr:hypothetical protein [Nocardia transvalensis]